MTNRMDIAAAFPPRGFVPDTASAHTDALKVPARLLGLQGYGDIGGNLRADWQTNHFSVQLLAQTASPSTNLPPLNLELHISGDTNAARLEVAKISIPALRAELVAPVTVDFRPPYLSQPATLNLAADLDQQHWFVGQGKLTGQAVVSPTEKIPRVSFTLTGQGVATTTLTSSNLAVEGELTWPVLDLKNVRIELADASTVSLSGQYDIARQIVSNGHLDSSGTFGGQFLPAGYSFRSASVTGQFEGPLTSVTNSAKAQVKEFKTPPLDAVDADISWNGQGLNFTSAQIALKAGQSSLLLRGSGRLERGDEHLMLTAFELRRKQSGDLASRTAGSNCIDDERASINQFNLGPQHCADDADRRWAGNSSGRRRELAAPWDDSMRSAWTRCAVAARFHSAGEHARGLE